MASLRGQRFTAWQVYKNEQNLPLGRGIGRVKTASYEVLRAHVAGTQPDPAKIGSPGDGLKGGRQIAAALNEIFFGTAKAATQP